MALSAATQSRKAQIQKWRRRSAVVKFWRTALPATIVAILIALSGWAVARGILYNAKTVAPIIGEIQMVNGMLHGRDSNDRAFLLAALRAVRDARSDAAINLESPTFNLGAGKAEALKGIYLEDKGELILRGDVVIVDADGGVIRTQEALIDTKTGVVTNTKAPGSGGIQIESNMGKINAEDYIVDKNRKVTFKGRFSGEFKVKSK